MPQVLKERLKVEGGCLRLSASPYQDRIYEIFCKPGRIVKETSYTLKQSYLQLVKGKVSSETVLSMYDKTFTFAICHCLADKN